MDKLPATTATLSSTRLFWTTHVDDEAVPEFQPSSAAEMGAVVSSPLPNATASMTASDAFENPEWLKTFGLVTDGVLTNAVIVGGLVANALTLAVLARPTMRTSTNSFLSALAIWDSVVLLCSATLIGLPGLPSSWLWTEAYRRNGPLAYAISYIYPLALIAQTATIWLTVSFAVERYIGVHYPLKAVTLCTVQRARWVIATVCLMSFAYNVSRWFEYRPMVVLTADVDSPNDTRHVIDVALTPIGLNDVYQRIYFSWLYLPVMCIAPLAALTVINTSLFLAVRRSHADRKQMNVRQSRENNVTIVLVAVVAVFIVCQVPALAYNVAYAVDAGHVLRSPGYRALSHVRNLLVNVNSAVNFLLYCVFGQKFRRVFLMAFCHQCPKKVCGSGIRTGSARSTGVITTTGMCVVMMGNTIDVFGNIPLDQRQRSLRRLGIGGDDAARNSLIGGSLRTHNGGDSTRRLLQTSSGALCEGGGITIAGGGKQSGRLVHC